MIDALLTVLFLTTFVGGIPVVLVPKTFRFKNRWRAFAFWGLWLPIMGLMIERDPTAKEGDGMFVACAVLYCVVAFIVWLIRYADIRNKETVSIKQPGPVSGNAENSRILVGTPMTDAERRRHFGKPPSQTAASQSVDSDRLSSDFWAEQRKKSRKGKLPQPSAVEQQRRAESVDRDKNFGRPTKAASAANFNRDYEPDPVLAHNDRHPLRFEYASACGEITVREIVPWKEKGPHITGRCRLRRAHRTFRKDRVLEYFDGTDQLLYRPNH